MPDLNLHHICLPPRAPVEGNPPAIVLLHGLGADETDLLPIADELPDEMMVFAPRAPFAYELGGYKWYDRDISFNLNTSALDDISCGMEAFLSGLVEAYPIDPSQVWLFGFSMGSAVAMTTLLSVPRLVAGAIALSGFLPEDPEGRFHPQAGKPIFVGHGIDDPIVPIVLARMAKERLIQYGQDLTYREYDTEHSIAEQELADVLAWLASRLTN